MHLNCNLWGITISANRLCANDALSLAVNFTLGSQAHRRIKRVLNPGSIHLITLSCRFLITRKEPSDYKRHTEPKLDLSSRVTSSVTCQCMTHAPNIYGKEYFITSMRFRFLWLSKTMTVRTPETRT